MVWLMAHLAASVIVPTYGGLRRLPALLDALTEQDMSEPWEVVISLDGIVDESKALVEQYRSRLNLVVVESTTSTGVSAALNRGFAAASGEVLIRCDDDLTPRPSMVRRHVELHRQRPRTTVNAAYRDIAVPTPFGRVYGSRAAAARRQQWYARPVPDRWIDCAGHLSVDRATWELAAPGFDESIPYGEDSEMAYRLVKRGVEVHLAPELEIEHRGAPRLAANRVPRAFNAGAGSRVFALRHPEAVPAEPPLRPSSFRAAVWSWSIRVVSRALRTPRPFALIGRALDVCLPVLPAAVGYRLVAWAVECAGASGRQHGPDDLFSLTGQKSRELQAETADGRFAPPG